MNRAEKKARSARARELGRLRRALADARDHILREELAYEIAYLEAEIPADISLYCSFGTEPSGFPYASTTERIRAARKPG
jgi:hypothetical protein